MSVKHLKEIKIPVPSVERQRQIVAGIQFMEMQTQQLQNIYQQKLDFLDELKQALLAKAFAGELTAQPEQILKEAVG
jgi:type I restriction enzyme S subunit